MKKLLLALCVMLALLLGVAAAENTGFGPGEYINSFTNNKISNQIGDFEYIVLKDGSAEIVGYLGNKSDLTIPHKLNGIQVTSIGREAFAAARFLTSVEIPKGVVYIGYRAFNNCNALTNIIIPESITTIDYGAFGICLSLTNISLPEGMTTISEALFFHCRSLINVSIPKSISIIGPDSFRECDSLTSVHIHENVTEIGENAFADCPNLILTVCPGTVAEQYAKDNDIPYVYLKPWTCEPCQNYTDRYFCTECGAECPAP